MSDKGTNITCQATDDLGKVSNMSNTVTLDPYYGPDDVKLEPPNMVINVTEGSTLGPIRCHANCHPKCKYQWKQNATGPFENVETKHVSNDNQNLNVSNIKRGQAATFRCSVNHQYSDHKGRTDISVNVQYSPEIVAIRLIDKFGIAGHGNLTTYNFNEDVNIMTTLRINSNPESKLFLRSYLKIYQLNHTKVATDYKSKLISLKCEDSGNFEIQARNGIPYGDNKTVNFIISCKPRNVTTRSSKIGTKVNTRENIELQVVSFPEPTVQWLRSTGFDWTVKKDIYDYKYKISSTIHIGSEKDFGEYRLKICNSLGCIGERITLTPEDKPEAPQNISLKTTSFRSVNLSWIAGFNGGDHQTFSVQLKTLYDEKWETRVVHTNITRKGSMVYYTLDQLKPDTSYQVIVLSTNKHGKRNASLQFQTKVEPTLSSCASSNSASISHLTVGLGCGIPPLLVVIILLVYIYRRNQDNTSDLKEKKVKSEQSNEYTVIQRSHPTFTEAYSTLHSPTELTALQANSMETDTYDECGVLADVEVNQTMDNSKRGASIDKQESGQEQTKEGMYDNMKI